MPQLVGGGRSWPLNWPSSTDTERLSATPLARPSFYGWGHDVDDGLVARYPHLDNGKGTLRLPLTDEVHISDDELRAFLAAALAE